MNAQSALSLAGRPRRSCTSARDSLRRDARSARDSAVTSPRCADSNASESSIHSRVSSMTCIAARLDAGTSPDFTVPLMPSSRLIRRKPAGSPDLVTSSMTSRLAATSRIAGAPSPMRRHSVENKWLMFSPTSARLVRRCRAMPSSAMRSWIPFASSSALAARCHAATAASSALAALSLAASASAREVRAMIAAAPVPSAATRDIHRVAASMVRTLSGVPR